MSPAEGRPDRARTGGCACGLSRAAAHTSHQPAQAWRAGPVPAPPFLSPSDLSRGHDCACCEGSLPVAHRVPTLPASPPPSCGPLGAYPHMTPVCPPRLTPSIPQMCPFLLFRLHLLPRSHKLIPSDQLQVKPTGPRAGSWHPSPAWGRSWAPLCLLRL